MASLADSPYPPPDAPAFCTVNEYRGFQGISVHVENFRLAEPVCGFTFGDGDSMGFHELRHDDDASVRSRGSGRAARKMRTGRKVGVWMPLRSLLVMREEARSRWHHEIIGRKKERVGKQGHGWKRATLTFRVEREREMPGNNDELPPRGRPWKDELRCPKNDLVDCLHELSEQMPPGWKSNA